MLLLSSNKAITREQGCGVTEWDVVPVVSDRLIAESYIVCLNLLGCLTVIPGVIVLFPRVPKIAGLLVLPV